MNAISTFTFESSSQIRIIMINNEPWFVAKDICDALYLSNHRDAISKLDTDEKGVALTDTLGGQQKLNIINESGMYALIMRSRDAMKQGTPQHKFRKWVTSEVLPSIRKTGQYKAPVPTQKTDYLTDADMINLKRLVWHCAKLGFQEETITKAIWYCFRQVTNTPSPNKFNADDLPELANEFQRIYNVLTRYKKICLNAENLVIKQLLRARSADETIFQDIVQSFDTVDLNFNNELNRQLKLNFHAKDFINRKLI